MFQSPIQITPEFIKLFKEQLEKEENEKITQNISIGNSFSAIRNFIIAVQEKIIITNPCLDQIGRVETFYSYKSAKEVFSGDGRLANKILDFVKPSAYLYFPSIAQQIIEYLLANDFKKYFDFSDYFNDEQLDELRKTIRYLIVFLKLIDIKRHKNSITKGSDLSDDIENLTFSDDRKFNVSKNNIHINNVIVLPNGAEIGFSIIKNIYDFYPEISITLSHPFESFSFNSQGEKIYFSEITQVVKDNVQSFFDLNIPDDTKHSNNQAAINSFAESLKEHIRCLFLSNAEEIKNTTERDKISFINNLLYLAFSPLDLVFFSPLDLVFNVDMNGDIVVIKCTGKVECKISIMFYVDMTNFTMSSKLVFDFPSLSDKESIEISTLDVQDKAERYILGRFLKYNKLDVTILEGEKDAKA